MHDSARSWAMATALFTAALVPLPAAALDLPSAAPGNAGHPSPADGAGDRVTLFGHVHPLARRENDTGAADPELPMRRIILLLQRRPGAEADLGALLDAQRDPASPSYHNWLTPEAFGQRFGVGAEQAEAVAAWLRSEGLTVDEVARGRGWIQVPPAPPRSTASAASRPRGRRRTIHCPRAT